MLQFDSFLPVATNHRFAILFLCGFLLASLGIPSPVSALTLNEESPLSKSTLKIGDELPEFQLADVRGKSFASNHWNDQPLVVFFFGVECPIVQLYAGELEAMGGEKDDPPVRWIGINSNQQDSLREIEVFQKKSGIEFPLLKDPGNQVADLFGATRTPEVFLFDRTGKLRYRGAIDDRYHYGQQKPKADQTFLADAIEAVCAGRDPRPETTDAVGCIIGRKMVADPGSPVTYSNQISRIIQRRCLECHRSGEIAPFSLMDYDEVVGWAEMIQEVVEDRRMPPWHANPEFGHFKNDASLTDDELKLIQQWVAAGAPEGDPDQLPEPIAFVEGWRIGNPDVVIPMADQPFSVPATGVVPYEYFVVDPKFTEDKWIQAAECRIGNRAVVHHIIVAVHDKRNKQKVHGQVESEFITATAPGARPLRLPEGYAKLIPAGSKLVFQMHYTPNGTPQKDLSSVGLIFADPATVKKSVGTREAVNNKFRIPPGAENHRVTSRFRFHADSLMLSMFPHMHLRGKSFRYIATYPDGKSEILLDVPRFDFNWQNGYELDQPKRMPKGTVLECVAHFDNSKNNFANPDPDRTVRWGDQTWDEMMIGYFDMVYEHQDLSSSPRTSRTEALLAQINQGESLVQPQLVAAAKDSLKTSTSMKQFGRQLQQAFPQVDRICWTIIKDGKLTVRRVAQVGLFEQNLQGEGVSTDATGCRIWEIMNQGQPVSLNDLASLRSPDIRFMSAVANSSFHVPLEIGGVSGTINFWSSEENAFPEPVQVQLLELVTTALENQ